MTLEDYHKKYPARAGDTVEKFEKYEAFIAKYPSPSFEDEFAAYQSWYSDLTNYMESNILPKIRKEMNVQEIKEKRKAAELAIKNILNTLQQETECYCEDSIILNINASYALDQTTRKNKEVLGVRINLEIPR
jgi:hypothetical protein